MAFVQDILNVIGDDCLDFKITILGRSGVICEGYKHIVKFGADKIVIKVGKAIIAIIGESFKIEELASEYIQISGKVNSIERLDVERGHDKG